MPPAAICANALTKASYITSGVGSGMYWVTSPCAASLRTPVASPLLSRTISPPVGSGVFWSMPAIWSALLLTHVLCPSDPLRAMGRDVASESRMSLCGRVSLGVPAGFHASTVSHASGSEPNAGSARNVATRSCTSTAVSSASSSDGLRARSPAYMGWTWPSWMPDMTVPPLASTTSVPYPEYAATCRFVPTARIRPSVPMATASAMVLASSPTNTRALRTIVAALVPDAAALCAKAGTVTAAAPAPAAADAPRK